MLVVASLHHEVADSSIGEVGLDREKTVREVAVVAAERESYRNITFISLNEIVSRFKK